MENEVAVKESGQLSTGSPESMIRLAISSGADLDKLEKLLTLQERWESGQARKMYAEAFAAAQSEIKAVVKGEKNTQTNSKYAALEGIIEMAQPIYTKYGFAMIFYEGDCSIPEHFRIFADVLHKAGHKETYHFDIPLDGKGLKGNANMTAIHGKASSSTYGRRYLMCMIWNIPTQDNDGNSVVEKINEKQRASLVEMLKEIGEEGNPTPVAKYCGVEKIEEIAAKDYQKAVAAIKARKSQKKGAVK